MLKSPAKILRLWEKGTADYKKANKLKELELQEEFHNKKIVTNLKKLRTVARKEEDMDVEQFSKFRDETCKQMDRLRRLFKAKKDRPAPLKKFYGQVCKLTLTVEALEAANLDASEDEVDERVLDGIDENTLDTREEKASQDIGDEIQQGMKPKAPEAPPQSQAPTPGETPGEEMKKFTKRLAGLMPDIKVLETATTTVGDRVRAGVAEARQAVAQKDYRKANEHLDKVEPLLEQGMGEISMTGEFLDKRSTQIKISEKDRQLRLQDNTVTHDNWKQEATSKLTQYTTTGKTASGGYGIVHFLKNDTDPNAPPLVVKTAKGSEMEKEAKLFEKVGPHPNVVKCLDFTDVGGKKGLVMECLGGGELTDNFEQMNKMLAKGEISEEKYWGVLQFTMQRSLEALAYLEEKGLVHNDIKPPNIMIDDVTGEPKLIDLGLLTEDGKDQDKGTWGFLATQDIYKATIKRDVFAVGSSGWEVREGKTDKAGKGKQFDYGGKYSGMGDFLPGMKALQVSDKPDEVSDIDPDTGERKKKLRMYGANTAYVDFINRLMDPDPAKRPSPKEALQHPFMRQRLLDDESAREAVKDVARARKAPPDTSTPAKDVKFTVAPEFADTTWRTTMGNAMTAGAVPDVSGLVAGVAEALKKYEDQRGVFQGLKREDNWDAKKAAAEKALAELAEVERGVRTLQGKKECAANATMSGYLAIVLKNALNRPREFEEFFKLGKPVITASGFKASWSNSKAIAEAAFKQACKDVIKRINTESTSKPKPKDYIKERLAALGLDKGLSLDKFFGFNENFGSALEGFDKAISKDNAKDKLSARAKALGIIGSYLKKVLSAPRLEAPGPDFRASLTAALMDLVTSINRKG
jgi:serine/threonine protein kinase